MARTMKLQLIVALLAVAYACPETCNGHGFCYDDTNLCECFNCYSGATCDMPVENCLVQAVGGNPLLFQEFWANCSVADTYIPSFYRTGYQQAGPYTPGMPGPGMGGVLASAIVELHKSVGNVNTDGYSIVIGQGGTQLITASTFCGAQAVGGPANVYAQPPYFGGYQVSTCVIANTTFSTATDLDPSSVIEFVTMPNNPTGEMNRTAIYPEATLVVHDMVYNWPSLTTPTVNASFPVMLFSLSKLTGNAGTRFGWALVRDQELAQCMGGYVSAVQLMPSIETQYRALNVFNALNNGTATQMFDYVRETLRARWSAVMDILATQDRFALHSVPGQFYVWLECTRPADAGNCYQVLLDGLIMGEPGPGFGASNAFVRMEIMQYDSDFNVLLANFRAVVNA